jgi:HPt (histidine-containing phosphotransfer) domain-containing protein
MFVSEFVDRGFECLEAVREALAAGDADEVVRLAHGLAGSCGVLGLPGLAGLAGELEHRVRFEGLEGAAALTAALVGAFPGAVRALRQATGEAVAS